MFHPSSDFERLTMNTSPKGPERKLPETNFEAMKWVHRDSPTKSHSAMSVSGCLASFWNPNVQEFCFPSNATIMERTGIRSEETVRKAVKELEALGEWAVVRMDRSSHKYYPMFVKNARTDLLATDIQQQQLERRALNEQRQSAAGVDKPVKASSKAAPVQNELPAPASDTTSPNARVQTDEDQKVLDAYLEHLEFRQTEPDALTPIPASAHVIEFVDPTFVDEFIDGRNPDRWYIAGAADFFYPELAGKWIADFGHLFGPTVTYSKIQKVYDDLTEPSAKSPLDHLTANVAVRLLGSKGRMPTAEFVRGMLFRPAASMEQDQLELRYIVQATVKCIEATWEYVERNHYGNRTPALEPTDSLGVTYSDQW